MKKPTMTEYDMTPRKIAYHPISKQTYPLSSPPKGCVIFDSTYEYKVYVALQKCSNSILVHPFSSVLGFHVDFVLSFNYNQQPSIINQLNRRAFKGNTLFVEAKGILTKDIKQKIHRLDTRIQECIVIVCDEVSTRKIGETIVISLKKLRELGE